MASKRFIAFMQGMTGAGLFGRLRRPGAPTEFIDSRTPEEYLQSGDFEQMISRFRAYIPDVPKQPDYVNIFPESAARAASAVAKEIYLRKIRETSGDPRPKAMEDTH